MRRVTFGVFGSRLRQKDLAPRSTGAMALFEQALQKWGYAAEARDDAILLRESNGLFVARFSLADELADLLKAAKETDAGRAVAKPYSARRAAPRGPRADLAAAERRPFAIGGRRGGPRADDARLAPRRRRGLKMFVQRARG